MVVGRTVHTSGGNGTELTCPNCSTRFEPGRDWSDAATTWHEGHDAVSYGCPHCGSVRLLAEWDGPYAWGFGNLAGRVLELAPARPWLRRPPGRTSRWPSAAGPFALMTRPASAHSSPEGGWLSWEVRNIRYCARPFPISGTAAHALSTVMRSWKVARTDDRTLVVLGAVGPQAER